MTNSPSVNVRVHLPRKCSFVHVRRDASQSASRRLRLANRSSRSRNVDDSVRQLPRVQFGSIALHKPFDRLQSLLGGIRQRRDLPSARMSSRRIPALRAIRTTRKSAYFPLWPRNVKCSARARCEMMLTACCAVTFLRLATERMSTSRVTSCAKCANSLRAQRRMDRARHAG